MSWYDAIKVAGDAIEKLKNAELNQLLATVRMEGAKLAEDNARLREDTLSLREAARLRGAMVFRPNAYWLTAEGQADDGPFCPRCWDGNAKLGRLLDNPGSNYLHCAVCAFAARKPGHVEHREDEPGGYEPIR